MAMGKNRMRCRLATWGSIALVIGGPILFNETLLAQSELESTGRYYLEGPRENEVGYSRAVVTRGGDVVWVSGTQGARDANGQLITDFRDQARQAFRNIDATLREVGSDLSDVVNITVLLRDPRYYDTFTEVRREFFPDGNYPAGTIVTNGTFVRPEILVLLQAVAVVAP